MCFSRSSSNWTGGQFRILTQRGLLGTRFVFLEGWEFCFEGLCGKSKRKWGGRELWTLGALPSAWSEKHPSEINVAEFRATFITGRIQFLQCWSEYLCGSPLIPSCNVLLPSTCFVHFSFLCLQCWTCWDWRAQFNGNIPGVCWES